MSNKNYQNNGLSNLVTHRRDEDDWFKEGDSISQTRDSTKAFYEAMTVPKQSSSWSKLRSPVIAYVAAVGIVLGTLGTQAVGYFNNEQSSPPVSQEQS